MQLFGYFIVFAIISAAVAQVNPDTTSRFDAESVKLAGPRSPGQRSGCMGGPGSTDPGSWICQRVSLTELLTVAYDLAPYQFNPPEWMSQLFLEVTAKLPPDTTKDRFHQMQQQLLQDRFHLASHWEARAMTLYELAASNPGAKFHESSSDAAPAETSWSRVQGATIGQDGFPVFPNGINGLIGVNGHKKWRSSNVTIADIVWVLKRDLNAEVVDATGLDGKYDIDIYWQQRPIEVFHSAPPFQGPDIERMLQDRLGLKLRSKKGMVNTFVIDRMDRGPVEN